MKAYSGSATFSTDIERYYNKESGAYLLMNDPSVPEDDEWEEFEFQYKAITLTIVGSVTSTPAKLSGHPDDRSPDESEVDMQSITDEHGNNWMNSLTEREYDDVVTQLFQEVEYNLDESYNDSYDSEDDFYEG